MIINLRPFFRFILVDLNLYHIDNVAAIIRGFLIEEIIEI